MVERTFGCSQRNKSLIQPIYRIIQVVQDRASRTTKSSVTNKAVPSLGSLLPWQRCDPLSLRAEEQSPLRHASQKPYSSRAPVRGHALRVKFDKLDSEVGLQVRQGVVKWAMFAECEGKKVVDE